LFDTSAKRGGGAQRMQLEMRGGEVQAVGELDEGNLHRVRVEVPAQGGQHHHLHILKKFKQF